MPQATNNNGPSAAPPTKWAAIIAMIIGFFHAQPENWLARSGLALAIVSGIASGYGALQLAMAVGMSAWVAVPMSIGFGLLVQLIVVSAILMLANGVRDLGALVIALLIVLGAAWSLSVTSSYGTFWGMLAKSSYEERATTRAIRAKVEPLNAVSLRFTNATNAFQQLADHAQAKSIEEANDGTSCGYQTQVGRGPRFRLRERQSAEAQRLAGELTARNETLALQIARLNGSDRSQLDNAYRLAAATVTGGAVSSSRSFITAESAGFADGFGEGEFQFTCSDPVMQRYLDDAMAALDDLPEISPTPPEEVIISDSEGMLLSASRLWRAAFGAEQEEDVIDADLAPLAIPFIIEVIMTALLVLGYQRGNGSGTASMAVPGAFRPGSRIKPSPALMGLTSTLEKASEGSILEDAFAEHVILSKDFDDAVLVVPQRPGPERERSKRLKTVARHVAGGLRKVEAIERIEGRFAWSALPGSVTSGWNWNADYCELYRLPRRTVEKMRRLLADHAATVIIDEAHQAA